MTSIDDSQPAPTGHGGAPPPNVQAIGRYKVIRELGRGAMGVVYEALDPKIGRKVALKVLHEVPGISEQELEEFKSRFFREARTAGMLSHSNIVVIHDVDSDETLGISFMAMEVLKGQSVYDLLRSGVRFTTEQAVDICVQVAEGLDHAHRQGIVHRDVKPANLMLLEDGTVKITDFGIAKISTSNLTRTGQFLGTPNYMSPEQVIGHVIDGRSDLFSLGIILYELLTGEKPFMGSSLTTITYQIVNVDPIEPSKIRVGLPKKYDAIVQKMLRKAPDERFQTGKEVAEALRAARDNQPIPGMPGAGPDPDATHLGGPRTVGTGQQQQVAGADATAVHSLPQLPTRTGPSKATIGGIAAGVVIVGLVIALVLSRSQQGGPAPTTATGATVAAASLPPSAPASTVAMTSVAASTAPELASAPVASAPEATSAPASAPRGTSVARSTAPRATAATHTTPLDPGFLLPPRATAAPAPAPTAAQVTGMVDVNVVLKHELKDGTFTVDIDGKQVFSRALASTHGRKKETITATFQAPEGKHQLKVCVASAAIQDGPKCASLGFSFVMNRTATLRAEHGKPTIGSHWFTATIE
jgi:serine/threonine-protein kinase